MISPFEQCQSPAPVLQELQWATRVHPVLCFPVVTITGQTLLLANLELSGLRSFAKFFFFFPLISPVFFIRLALTGCSAFWVSAILFCSSLDLSGHTCNAPWSLVIDCRFLGEPLLGHESFLLICILERVLFLLFYRDAKFNHIIE